MFARLHLASSRRRSFLRDGAWALLLCLFGWSCGLRAQVPAHLLAAGMNVPHGSKPASAATPNPGPSAPALGSIDGTITDASEGIVPGATVTLGTPEGSQLNSTTSDAEGAFSFHDVPSGPYTLRVNSPGYKDWSDSGTLARGQAMVLPEIALVVLPSRTAVEVSASRREIATAQLSLAEKQRVLGVFPNFYASYVWDAEPLTARQKYSLAWHFSVDPVAFGMAGVAAGAEQMSNSLPGYGPGAKGYARRFGAAYVDGFNSTLLGQAVLPAAFHQDPRYFVKGTGTVPARALYAIATAVICKGDNQRWQLNYSNILGNLAAAGASNLYYPAGSRRGVDLTVQNAGITTAMGALGGLIQEFMLHRMTPNLPDYSEAAGR